MTMKLSKDFLRKLIFQEMREISPEERDSIRIHGVLGTGDETLYHEPVSVIDEPSDDLQPADDRAIMAMKKMFTSAIRFRVRQFMDFGQPEDKILKALEMAAQETISAENNS